MNEDAHRGVNSVNILFRNYKGPKCRKTTGKQEKWQEY